MPHLAGYTALKALRGGRYAALLCLLLVPARVQAQNPTVVEPGGWIVGGSVGIPGAGRSMDPALTTLGLYFTQVRPGRLGADISVGTMPLVLAASTVLGGPPIAVGIVRLDATVPISITPGVVLLPCGGLTVLAKGHGETNRLNLGIRDGSTAGANLGVAVAQNARLSGFRVGITWHRLANTNRSFWVVEMGLGNFLPEGL